MSTTTTNKQKTTDSGVNQEFMVRDDPIDLVSAEATKKKQNEAGDDYITSFVDRDGVKYPYAIVMDMILRGQIFLIGDKNGNSSRLTVTSNGTIKTIKDDSELNNLEALPKTQQYEDFKVTLTQVDPDKEAEEQREKDRKAQEESDKAAAKQLKEREAVAAKVVTKQETITPRPQDSELERERAKQKAIEDSVKEAEAANAKRANERGTSR